MPLLQVYIGVWAKIEIVIENQVCKIVIIVFKNFPCTYCLLQGNCAICTKFQNLKMLPHSKNQQVGIAHSLFQKHLCHSISHCIVHIRTSTCRRRYNLLSTDIYVVKQVSVLCIHFHIEQLAILEIQQSASSVFRIAQEPKWSRESLTASTTSLIR